MSTLRRLRHSKASYFFLLWFPFEGILFCSVRITAAIGVSAFECGSSVPEPAFLVLDWNKNSDFQLFFLYLPVLLCNLHVLVLIEIQHLNVK